MSEHEPVRIGDRRLLGVVPGQPIAGKKKVPEDEKMVMVWPHLLIRHGVVAIAILLVVLVLGLLFDAPLREVANPFETPNPEKAPWYFAALQELLSHFHPLVAGVLVPGTIVIGLAALPFLDRSPHLTPARRKVSIWVFTIFLVIWIVLTIVGFAFRGPNWGWVWPWVEWHGEL